MEALMETLYFNNQSGTIAYDDTGSGPLVVCVPGIGDLRGEYRFLREHLVQAGYRVISMDIRGHGESGTTWEDFSVAGVGGDIVALLRSLEAGPAIIAGTSMAAGAAVWAAVEAPELVAGLVLLGPSVHGEVTWANRLLYTALFARPWGAAVWVKYFSTLFPTHKPDDFTEYCAALRANLSEPGRVEALLKLVLASKAAAEARLPRVTAPALVIMGSKDSDFKDPAAEAQWVADQVHGRHVMIPEAGHYPHVEMPDIAGAQILAFLDSVKSKAGVDVA
jgi:pimeloyl-ACP methyl ester carboxylesterase